MLGGERCCRWVHRGPEWPCCRTPASRRGCSESGQLLVETLIAITILVILSTAGIAVLASGVLSQSLSRQRTIAEQLALQDMEAIRQLGYTNVGTLTGNPHGTLAASQAISSTVGLNGTLKRQITWVDDPAPGTPYVTHADYKRVTITITRSDGKVLTTQTSYFSPFDASDYGGPNVGSLQITVQDMASTAVVPGVTVTIAGGPSGTASDTTDATGVASFPALQPNPSSGSTKCYEVTVTPPPGYTVYSKDAPSSCGSSPADAVITAAQTTSTHDPHLQTGVRDLQRHAVEAAVHRCDDHRQPGRLDRRLGGHCRSVHGPDDGNAHHGRDARAELRLDRQRIVRRARRTVADRPDSGPGELSHDVERHGRDRVPRHDDHREEEELGGCLHDDGRCHRLHLRWPRRHRRPDGHHERVRRSPVRPDAGPELHGDKHHRSRRHDGHPDRDRLAVADRHRHHRHGARGRRHRDLPVKRTLERFANDRRGFTLVEMLVGMAILGIVLASMAALLSAIYNTGTQTVEAGTLQDEARAAVDTLVTDLRQGYTGDPSVPVIASFSGTSITFYSPDRQQPFHLRKIAYQMSGSTLQRASVTSTDTDGAPWLGLTTLGGYTNVASSIVANPGGTPLFSYVKSDGVTTATAAKDIDRVIVTVTVKQPGSRNQASTYQSSADIRAFVQS